MTGRGSTEQARRYSEQEFQHERHGRLVAEQEYRKQQDRADKAVVALVQAEERLLKERKEWSDACEVAEAALVQAEERIEAMETCVCVPDKFSSRACPRCGRKAVAVSTELAW